MSSFKGGDEDVTITLADVVGLGWHAAYEAKIAFYKRLAGRRLRGLVSRTI